MATNQFLHEIGVLILGGSACGLIQVYTPLQPPMKQGAVAAVALGTIFYMARIAGLL